MSLVVPRQYFVRRSLAVAFALVSGLIVARQLGPEGRGIVAVMLITALVVASVSAGGLATFSRLTLMQAPERHARRDFVTVVAVASLVSGILGACTAWIILGPRVSLMIGLTTLLLSIAFVVASVTMGMTVGVGDFSAAAGLELWPALFAFISLVIAVVVGFDDVWLYPVSLAIANIVVCGPRMSQLMRLLPTQVAAQDSVGVGHLIAKVRRFWWIENASLLILRSDRLAVAAFFPVVWLGYYSVASTMASLWRVLPDSSQVVISQSAPLSESSGNRAALARALRHWLLHLVPLVLVFILGPHIVVPLFGPEFLPAVGLVQLLCVAEALWGAYVIVTGLLLRYKRSRALPWISPICIAAFVTTALVLQPSVGVPSLGWAAIVASAIALLGALVVLVVPRFLKHQ